MNKDDLVQHIKTKRTYHIIGINPDGTLNLYKHGWPRIRNANPANWRLVERVELEAA